MANVCFNRQKLMILQRFPVLRHTTATKNRISLPMRNLYTLHSHSPTLHESINPRLCLRTPILYHESFSTSTLQLLTRRALAQAPRRLIPRRHARNDKCSRTQASEHGPAAVQASRVCHRQLCAAGPWPVYVRRSCASRHGEGTRRGRRVR